MPRRRTLFVEDEADDFDLACRALTNFKFDSDVAYDVAYARRNIRERKPDIIFLDIQVPVREHGPFIDFEELLGFITENRYTSCVIMLTADMNPSSIKQCVESGASGFISKVLIHDPPELCRRVDEAVRFHRETLTIREGNLESSMLMVLEAVHRMGESQMVMMALQTNNYLVAKQAREASTKLKDDNSKLQRAEGFKEGHDKGRVEGYEEGKRHFLKWLPVKAGFVMGVLGAFGFGIVKGVLWVVDVFHKKD